LDRLGVKKVNTCQPGLDNTPSEVEFIDIGAIICLVAKDKKSMGVSD